MADLNMYVFTGRLTRDPELRYTPSGTPVCSFTLAVSRGKPALGGEDQVEYPRCEVWKSNAEFAAKFFRKGMRVIVVGDPRLETWTSNDGTMRAAIKVNAKSVHFADGKPGGAATSEFTAPAVPAKPVDVQYGELDDEDGDLPF